MQLWFKKFDGRKRNDVPIVDEDTRKQVGTIRSGGRRDSNGSIYVLMFDGVYTMHANSWGECWGFVKGVEAVLNHEASARANAA